MALKARKKHDIIKVKGVQLGTVTCDRTIQESSSQSLACIACDVIVDKEQADAIKATAETAV